MNKQYCAIIGTKKGATTSLYEWLTQHHKVGKCFKKEPGFFSKDEEWEKGVSFFESLYSHNMNEFTHILDATTDYTQSGFEYVPERMFQLFPEAKIVYICRDPLDKMESQTHQFLIDGDTNKSIQVELNNSIIESLKYIEWLDLYAKFFHKSQIKVITFEQLKNFPSETLSEVTHFFGLPEFKYDTSFVHNKKNSALGQSYTAYRKVRSVLRFLKITPYIPQVWKDQLRTIIGKLGNKSIKKEDYTLCPEQAYYLSRLVEESVRRLEREWEIDTSNWRIWRYLEH